LPAFCTAADLRQEQRLDDEGYLYYMDYSKDYILQALTRVLTVPSYKENAVKISESFRSCGGAKEARAFLEEVASK